MRIAIVTFLLLLAVTFAFGQEPQAPMAPSYVAVGAGFASTATQQLMGGAAYLRPVTENGKTLAYTAATFTSTKPNTVEPGAAQQIIKRGPLALYALGTAGVAMGADNVGSIVSGGGFAMFDLSKWLKNVGVLVGAREVKSTITDAQPALFFALTYKLTEE